MKGKFFMWYKKWEFFLDNTVENIKKIPFYFPYIKSNFKKRPILFIGTAFLLISLPIFYLVTIFNKSPEAAWFDDSFAYRVAFEIANRSNYTAKNIPYKIIIDTATLISAGKMRSDGADIRVVDNKGKVPRFQVELSTLNTSTTAIWFEGNINSKSSAIYYVYYGNNNARKLSFISDIKSIATDNTYVETIDGFKYLNSTSYGRISGIYKNNLDLGVSGNYHYSNGYPNAWWDDRAFTRTILANGPLFVEIKMEDTNYGNYTSFGTNIKNFKNGFSEVRVFMNYSATTADTLYYYLSFTSGTRNSVWVNSSGTLVDQSANSGNLYLSALGEDWFGQRWTTSGYYGGTIFNRNSSDWYYGGTSAQSSYYQTNYSYSATKNSGESREIRYGIFAGDGGLTEMQEKGGTYGAYTTTLKTEEKTEAPVAYWKFDEGVGNVAYDASSNKNNGIISGATWKNSQDCISDNCLSFDGLTNYANFGNPNTYNFQDQPFSIGVWINPKSTNAGYIFHKGLDSTSWDGYSLKWNGNTISFNLYKTYGSVTGNLVSSSSLPINKWAYVVATYTGSTMNIYINGKLNNSVNYSGGYDKVSGYNAIMGKHFAANTSYYNGLIDEFKIYSYARSDKQVLADYNAGLARQSSNSGISASLGSISSSNLSNGLVGYWKMDEVSAGIGSTSYDTSGNNNNGIGVGATGTSVVSGKFGNGRGFNGTSDSINVVSTNFLPLIGNSYSIGFWIKDDTVASTLNGTFHRIISFANGTTNIQVGLANDVAPAGNRIFYILEGINSSAIKVVTGAVSNGWHHVVVTRDNTGQYHIYLDGILADNGRVTSSGSSVYTTNSGFLYIGQRGDGAYINGSMDELRIYNRALSPSEVTDLYNYAPGPVGYWDFEEGVGSTVYDKSGNGNNGAWNGTLGSQWTNGKYGKAGNFNGGSNYISLPHIDLNYAFTSCSWVKTKDQNDNPIIGNWQDGGVGDSWLLLANWSSGNKIDWFVRAPVSGGTNITENNPNLLNKWNYICGVFDNGKAYIYRNGVLTSSNSNIGFSSVYQNALNLWIGRYGSQYFNGNIDEVKVYNYARSQKQIIQDMNAGHPAGGSPVGSQIGYWKMDEGYGSVINNTGNSGTLMNGNFGTGGSAPTWSSDGQFGKALNFNNTNSYVALSGYSALNNSSEFSASVWVKSNNTSQDQTILSANPPFFLRISGGKFRVALYTNSAWTFANGTINLNNNTWYHLMLTYDGSYLKSYVNGALDVNTAKAGVLSGFAAIYLGRPIPTGEQYPFNGMIDEVKIYNSALTEDEVKIDYNRGQAMQFGSMSSGVGNTASSNAASQEYCVPGDTVNCAPPVGEYKFNEGVGSTAYDISGNNLDLPFVGSPKWVNGKSGKALNFNGSTDYLYNSSIRKTLPGSLTFEAWIRTKSTDSTKSYSGNAAQNVIGDSTGSVALGFGITGGKLQYNHYISSWNAFTGTTSINDGKWHHIAVSHISGSIVLYVDGRQEITGSLAYNGSSAYNIIGRGYSADHFTGDIDEVKIYNYVRTPAQIAWDYNRGEPIAHYAFDECQGSVIHDKSSNRLDGNLNIGASGTQTSAGSCESSGTAWGNGATGRYNSSLNFDGTDDYVTVNTNTALTSLTEYSVSGWVKWIAGSNVPLLLFSGSNGVYPIWGSGRPLIFHSAANYRYFNSPVTIQDGNWHHLVFIITGSGINDIDNSKCYVDGLLATTYSTVKTAAPPSKVAPITIGGTNNYFNGQIDDVKVFNYALTDTQIKTLYNNGAVSFAP